jgi:mRNA-degrading endonuclease toxin of MazEF toxin-antitoxin module
MEVHDRRPNFHLGISGQSRTHRHKALLGGTAGLAKTSWIVKLTKKLGTLPPESLREVEEGLRGVIDLD